MAHLSVQWFFYFKEECQRMLTLFVRGLPPSTTEASLKELFGGYGKVFDMKLTRDLFTGRARGIATVNMEGHEARSAIAGLDGQDFEGKTIYVAIDKGPKGGRGHR
ncbi:MAG TPA: RNA-binding protein [Methylococcaceae bacterium]|nr:RNA-binding protein [Methylococcaceae bacterium]